MNFQCCAISFIEHLTYESLSMPQEEFNLLMSGEKIYSSAWESALMACESLHLISQNLKTIELLDHRNDEVTVSVDVLNKDFDRLKVRFISQETNSFSIIFPQCL